MNSPNPAAQSGALLAGQSRITGLITAIEASPARAFAAFAILHIALWTLLPTFLCRDLPLDVLEGVAFGQHWQWGYWKHPPLPWVLDDAVRRITGPHIWGFFLLGQVAAVGCFWAVWRFGCEILRPVEALAGVVMLDSLLVFNAVTMEVNHNIIQLPFFGLAGWQLYRAFVRNRILDWALVGLWFALAFYCKYTAAVLLLPLLLFAILDPTARRCWTRPGIYISMLVFLALMSPHVVWLVGSDFSPLRYFSDTATVEPGLAPLAGAILLFIVNALLNVAGVVAIYVVMQRALWRRPVPAPPAARFAQRFLAVLTLGPLAVSVAASLLLQRYFPPSWSAQFWCFAGLFLIAIWRPRIDFAELRRLALAWGVATLAMVGVQVAGQVFLVNPSAMMSTQFPGDQFAAALTATWHKETGKPLAYVIGDDFETGNMVLFSGEDVAAYHLAGHRYNPWIDEADVHRKGAVLLWVSKKWRKPAYFAEFPQAEAREPVVVRQKTLRGDLVWTIHWALLRPAEP